MTNQQTYSYPPTDPPSAGRPEKVTSDPVPVPAPPDDLSDRTDEDREPVDRVDEDADLDGRRETAVDTGEGTETRDDSAEDVTDRVPEDALDDEGTFEDPALSSERTDPDDITAVTPRQDEPEFHEPPEQATAFGAATVGGAAAAAAQAGPYRDVDEEVADEESAVDEPVADTELMPGDVPAEPVTGLWSEETAQGLRDRWRDVQLRFIDDPASAATEARTLVDEAVTSLTESLTSQKNSLGEWDGDDTEHLRMVVRRYRDFLDRLLGL